VAREFPSSVLAFVTNMSEKHKCVLPSAIEMKNWSKTIDIAVKLDMLSQLEKGEQIVDIYCMLIAAYLQFLIMLIELKKLLSQ
jgi:lipopolysaccharide biosynthesis regulator YciM